MFYKNETTLDLTKCEVRILYIFCKSANSHITNYIFLLASTGTKNSTATAPPNCTATDLGQVFLKIIFPRGPMVA